MPLCCIGGVCIPYSALVPFLLYILKFIISFLPKEWQVKIMKTFQSTTTTTKQTKQKKINGDCCSTTTTTTTTGTSKSTIGDIVKLIESDDEWNDMLSGLRSTTTNKKSDRTLVVIKFTATWCGPCKEIRSTFEDIAKETIDKQNDTSASSSSTISTTFIEMDVDDCDGIAGDYNVAILPTFVTLEVLDSTTKEVARYTGSSKEKLRDFVVKNVV